MIVKPFKISLQTEALKSLANRLPQNHSKYRDIQSQLKKKIAGDIGEEVIMRELEKLKMPYKFHTFHDITLYAEKLFQMDILLITPHYALILEVKNFRDIVEIRSNPSQMIQTLASGEIIPCPSPETQIEEYIYQLTQFFNQSNIKIPVLGAIVFAFPTTYIKNSSNRTNILLKNELLPYLRSIKTQNSLIDEGQMEHIKNFILQKNIEYHPFPLSNKYAIDPKELITGVECEKCAYIGMKKLKRRWLCPKCQHTSLTAHEKTIKEYFLISQKTLSNKECREFLHLNNNHEATRIMKKAKLNKIGQSTTTKYQMVFPK